jgi:branched-chain amino acid transport system substrate-binding protein
MHSIRRPVRLLALVSAIATAFVVLASTAAGAGTNENEYALAYTGGTGGKADKKLAPITIGYINQEGGVPSFPEATAGINAAAKFVNNELGGAQKHPVAIKKCVVQTEEDGQRCATEMLNDEKVSFVMTGTLVVGNASIYSTLAGKKPVIIGFPGTVPDFVADDAYALTPGAVGVVKGMGIFVGENLKDVKKVSVVHSDNAAGKAGAESMLKPALEKYGITDITLVPVSDTATGPDLASAIQAAGAEQADLFVPLVSVQGCIATYDALQSLGIKPKVLTTGLCYGTPMTRHLKDVGAKGTVPNGWYYGDLGYSYFIPDSESGMETYLDKIKQYGPKNVEYTGFAGPLFANLLTTVKFVNQVGADNVTPESMRQAVQGFTGPMMLVAGPMQCGFSPAFKTLCGKEMGVQQYRNGKWRSIANALNGKAIDSTTA